MKIHARFQVVCKACLVTKHYAVTESDLCRLDIALTKWCACNVEQLITGDADLDEAARREREGVES